MTRTYKLTSNLGNVRTVTVSNGSQAGQVGVKITIDLLLPGESVDLSELPISFLPAPRKN